MTEIQVDAAARTMEFVKELGSTIDKTIGWVYKFRFVEAIYYYRKNITLRLFALVPKAPVNNTILILRSEVLPPLFGNFLFFTK